MEALFNRGKLSRRKSRASDSVPRTEPVLGGRSSSPEYSRNKGEQHE